MVLVCGIHRAGKTYFCKKIESEYECSVYSASDLIKNRLKIEFKDKKINDIKENQQILLDELNIIKSKSGLKETDFILDGHLCLLNKSNKIEKIPLEILKRFGIDNIIVIVDSVKNIKYRLKELDNIDWSNEFIELFQNKEIKYARELAKEIGADLRIIKNHIDGDMNEEQFDKNIVLPIKPEYADKILNGQKKYEYRKNICTDNIEKIYVYATSPVKAIIGEL